MDNLQSDIPVNDTHEKTENIGAPQIASRSSCMRLRQLVVP